MPSGKEAQRIAELEAALRKAMLHIPVNGENVAVFELILTVLGEETK